MNVWGYRWNDYGGAGMGLVPLMQLHLPEHVLGEIEKDPKRHEHGRKETICVCCSATKRPWRFICTAHALLTGDDAYLCISCMEEVHGFD